MKFISKFKFIIFAILLGAMCQGFITRSTTAPTGGHYMTDITQYFVNNPAQQQLNQINGILCIMSKTNFSHYTNQGKYLALVNQSACNMGNGGGNNSPEQSGQNQQNIMQIIVDSSRVDNGAQNVSLWATTVMGMGNDQQIPVIIQISLVINSSPTTTNPYGDFAMNYAGYATDSNGQATGPALMKGFMKTSNINGTQQLLFSEEDSNGQNIQQAAVVQNPNSAGYAKLFSNGNGSNQSTISVAFNGDNLYLDPDGSGSLSPTCYDRNSFNNVVYSYGLYDDNGERINTTSGFPITYNGQQGWIGYYGLWLPSNTLPTNGAAIIKTNSDGTQETGTLVATEGIMQLNTQSAYTLSQLAGVEININTPSNTPGSNTNDVLVWDNNAQTFKKVGTNVCNSNGCATTPLATPLVVGQSYFQTLANGYSGNTVYMWLNGLGRGGNTQLQVFDSCSYDQQQQTFVCSGYKAPTSQTQLNVWQNGVDVPIAQAQTPQTLYCVNNCPVMQSGQVVYDYPTYDGSGGANQYLTYTYYKGLAGDNSYVLLDPNNQPLVETNPNNPQISSGPLLTSQQLASITVGGIVEQWLIYASNNITSYYQWTSGAQNWNRYYSFQSNDGTIATFATPLQLVYTDTNGNSHFLQYAGFGNLQGIPGVCYDSSGNVTNNCGGNGNTWVPSYSIANGTRLTTMLDSSQGYWVKQLNVAQLPQVANINACDSLSSLIDSANQMTLPSISLWQNPNIGNKPTGSDVQTPKVVDGVDQ